MPDPQYPINCPKCGKPLVYVRTQGDTHFYRCERHGTVLLPPHGRVHLEDPNDPTTVH